MICPVVVFYDRVANEYSAPRLEINVGTAVRNFNFACKSDTVAGVDMELYKIGAYDTSSGCFTEVCEKPIFLCRYEVSLDE